MTAPHRLILGVAAVASSMVVLFAVPPMFFVPVTFGSTVCMMGVAFWLGGIRGLRTPSPLMVAAGLGSAALLYFLFYLGGAAIAALRPFGIGSSSEASIYSLIANPSNPVAVQLAVLLFDSAGYESFFRGVLQSRLQEAAGPGAAPLVALLDAGLHVVTLNPLWVGATFLTDFVWGLTYYYGKGLQASFTSHLVWDLAIFIVAPIR